MPRYTRPPLTLVEILRDGPAVGTRDLAAMSGLSDDTIRLEIAAKELRAHRSQRGRNTVFRIERPEARRWLTALGFHVPHMAVSAEPAESRNV